MSRMIESMSISVVAATVAVAGLACSNQKKAEKLSPGDVPHQVMHPVKTRFPGAEITSVEREKENGTVIYDFELRQQGRKYETDVKDDGTIVEIEKQVDLANVPSEVTHAVNAKYPGSTISEVMEVDKVSGTTETPDHYEVVLKTSDGKEKEVNVSKSGQISEEGGESAEKK
jgi:uncharacterized membrane protein YkoI